MPNTEAKPVFKNLAQAFSSPQASVNNATIEHSVTNSENEIIHVPVGDTIPYRNHSFDCTEEDKDNPPYSSKRSAHQYQ